MKNLNTYLKFIASIIVAVILLGCSNNSHNEDDYYSEEDGYEDGTYCADVTYHNPNTGTNSSYELEVEVQSNEVVSILWGNGGWMDEDHFSSESLDENGYCSFTSDKGYDYTVQITGQNCSFTDQTSFQNDVANDEESLRCPRCNKEKSEYDKYCDDCEDAYCENCGNFDNYKYSKYDLCSDCEEKKEREEKTCERCGSYDRWMGSFDELCSDCQRKEDEEGE